MNPMRSITHQWTACLLWLVTTTTFTLAESPTEWLRVLENDGSTLEQKARACQRLGEAGSEEAVSALAERLPDPVLNTYARMALERIPGRSAELVLQEALASTEGAARIGVIQSLGARRVTGALDALATLSSHEDEPVAVAAFHALGRLATDEAMAVILNHLEKGAESARKEAAATACLLSAEHFHREGDLKRERILCQAVLSHGPPKYRVAATRKLLLSAGTPDLFVEKLRATDAGIRNAALLTIRDRPTAALADALHGELARAHGPLQELIAAALRDCANEKTISVLLRHLDGAEPGLRQALLDSLASLGGAEAARGLLGFLPESDVKDALVSMGGDGVDRVLAHALMDSQKREGRLALIELLGRRRSPSARQPLLAQANSTEPAVQLAALEGLRPLVGPADVPFLIACYKTYADKPQAAAFSALVSACRRASSGDQVGELLLAEFKGARDAGQRSAWARILAAVGHAPALPFIAADLASSNAETVEAAIRLLSRWPDGAPLEHLFPLCEKPEYKAPSVRAVLTLLSASRRPEFRLTWLRKVHPFIESRGEKQAFIAGLGGTAHPACRDLLRPYLSDEDVQEEARAALKTLSRSLR